MDKRERSAQRAVALYDQLDKKRQANMGPGSVKAVQRGRRDSAYAKLTGKKRKTLEQAKERERSTRGTRAGKNRYAYEESKMPQEPKGGESGRALKFARRAVKDRQDAEKAMQKTSKPKTRRRTPIQRKKIPPPTTGLDRNAQERQLGQVRGTRRQRRSGTRHGE